MAGSNLATPLYAVYEREFGFSSAVLTVVFATYALVLAPSLLVFGQLSDRIGRRRVMAAGFLTATLGLVAVRRSRPPRLAVRGPRDPGPGGRDDQRRCRGRARRARPRSGGGPSGAGGLARPGRRQRLRAGGGRDAWPQWAPARSCCRSCCSALGRRRDRRSRSRSPSPARARAGSPADRAAQRPAGDPRAVRARERHRRRGVGDCRALPLGRALLRRGPARHLRSRAPRRDQRDAPATSCVAAIAARRWAPTPACRPSGCCCSPQACSRSSSPSRPARSRPARRRPADRRRPRNRVPRRAGPTQPGGTARPPRRGQRRLLHADLPRRRDDRDLHRRRDAVGVPSRRRSRGSRRSRAWSPSPRPRGTSTCRLGQPVEIPLRGRDHPRATPSHEYRARVTETIASRVAARTSPRPQPTRQRVGQLVTASGPTSNDSHSRAGRDRRDSVRATSPSPEWFATTGSVPHAAASAATIPNASGNVLVTAIASAAGSRSASSCVVEPPAHATRSVARRRPRR